MPPSHCYATSAPALSQTRASCAPCRSGKLPPAAPLLRVGSLLRLKAKNWERAVGAIFPKCLNFAQPQADDVTNDATMCLFGWLPRFSDSSVSSNSLQPILCVESQAAPGLRHQNILFLIRLSVRLLVICLFLCFFVFICNFFSFFSER